uniref:mitogen-activated protein kinase kinase n=1 Tax=Acrobeloides nanus TaxID=290746 RepID=A0A914ERS5_9BILA
VNHLSFPGEYGTIYEFNTNEIIDHGILETTSNHIVRKVEHIPSGHLMAIKYLIIPQTKYKESENEKQLKSLMSELETFYMLWECPEIVDCYGYCIHEGHVLLCMEMMDMSLRKLYIEVRDKREVFAETLVGYIFVKIINALVFCKEKGIMHRDIKPNNILINKK